MSPTRHRSRGFTLIELMVAVGLVVVLVSLAAPSMKRMIDVQRVNSINSQLVTDLQFARSEAASRNTHVRTTFNWDSTKTCYSIYTYNVAVSGDLTRCDCLQVPACTAAGSVEIKTVRIPLDLGVNVRPASAVDREFAFEPLTGALFTVTTDFPGTPLTQFGMVTFIDLQRSLRTTVSRAGRPTVCAPTGSKMSAPAC